MYMLWGPTGTRGWAAPGHAMALSHHLAMFSMRGVGNVVRQLDCNLSRCVNTAVLASVSEQHHKTPRLLMVKIAELLGVMGLLNTHRCAGEAHYLAKVFTVPRVKA